MKWLFGAVLLTGILRLPAAAQDCTGLWLGTLHAGPANLRVAVHIHAGPNGLAGTMDSLDQGANGIPISSIAQQGRSVKFEVARVMGSYEGTLSENGAELSGTWKQGGASLPLTFQRTEKLPEVTRPQDPRKPYPYNEEEVSYENRKAGVKFAGTLTLPRTAGPHPAVLLITGSGPQDRNESLFGHHPFLVLADYLTRRGIVVLRVDDRGVGGSTGKGSEATTEDFAGDALAGVEFLKGRKEVNPKQIGLAGHSEGGLIGPLAATQSEDVAFIVLMAGPGVPGDKLLEVQSYAVPKAMGAPEEMAATNRDVAMALIRAAKEEKDQAAAEKRYRAELEKLMTGWSESKRQMMAPLLKQADAQLKQMSGPWFRAFLALDPRPILMKVKVPVLALNGELDTQVSARQNLPAILEALEAGGNRDHTIVKLPRLNHLFQTAKTGSVAEYSQIEETIAPAALEAMGDWIVRHCGR